MTHLKYALTALMLVLAPGMAPAAGPELFDIWKINLGMRADEIPDEFVEHACGTRGGPPSVALSGFADFAKCRAEPSGLHEVYFRYDDEYEYWARANGLEIEIQLYSGTRVFDYPVILSLLFDDGGIVRGIRMVTDPRETGGERNRREFWTMGNFVRIRFGNDNWTCEELPRAEGETPAGSHFIKERCEKVLNGQLYMYERHYYHKKGQVFTDTHTGAVNTNAFESFTWFELLDEGYASDGAVISTGSRPAR